MGWFALLAGILGFAAVYFPPNLQVPLGFQIYVSLAAVAGLDSLIGGFRARQDGKFRGDVFVSGFVMNTLVAAFLAYLGERLGQPIALAAVVALVARIFINLSIIRREWLDAQQVTRAQRNSRDLTEPTVSPARIRTVTAAKNEPG